MEAVYARCCGVDVHKRTAVACAVTPGPGGGAVKEVRTFGTMTRDVLALGDWLGAHGVTHVAMESTGVYWTLPRRCPPTHVGGARRGALGVGAGRSGRRGSGGGRSPGGGWPGRGRRGCGGRPSCA